MHIPAAAAAAVALVRLQPSKQRPDGMCGGNEGGGGSITRLSSFLPRSIKEEALRPPYGAAGAPSGLGEGGLAVYAVEKKKKKNRNAP